MSSELGSKTSVRSLLAIVQLLLFVFVNETCARDADGIALHAVITTASTVRSKKNLRPWIRVFGMFLRFRPWSVSRLAAAKITTCHSQNSKSMKIAQRR